MTEVGRWREVSVAVIVTTAAVLLLTAIIRRPRHRLPPGPRGWPIFGSLLSLGTLAHKSLRELAKQYGPIMMIHLGSVRTLVVTSPDIAEEILRTHDQIMCSRPAWMIAAQYLTYGLKDIAFAPYGPHWRYMRKICTVGLLTATRINHFREIRAREGLAFLHFILEESQRGNAVNMGDCFSNFTLNNVTQMMMSKSYCVWTSDSKSALPGMRTSFQELLRELFVIAGAFDISDFVPLLKPFDLQGLQKRAAGLFPMVDKFLQNVIDEHQQRLLTPTPGNYREDFVDALLGIGKTKEFQERLSMDTIKAVLLDMVAAGTDTPSASALWTLTELIRHPEVMRRVQEELDSVVGAHRLVQEEDVSKLKYLHAVVKETFRLHAPAPLAIPHVSTQDCEIRGFHIPAKTLVIMNFFGIHTDPAVWERPQEFDPDRFLDSTVDFKGQDFNFIPFGSGRRMCPGMNLGVLMVLYALALLLHAVDFKTVEGQETEALDTSEEFGLVLYKRLPLTLSGKARLPNHVIYPKQVQSCS